MVSHESPLGYLESNSNLNKTSIQSLTDDTIHEKNVKIFEDDTKITPSASKWGSKDLENVAYETFYQLVNEQGLICETH